MEIRGLELENTKSYERETVAFSRGTNAICGPNGAGKSTILEALGYVLFDHVPCRPIANLVREGARTAMIAVTVLAEDEREYKVIRRCGGQNQYYVYDPELGGKVVEGASDVLSWLKEQFGVEETVDLAALFHDAVGVPQGLLTAVFLDKPSIRKAVFNPLLRVEEYGEVFDRLLEARRALDERVHQAEVEIATLRAEVRDLPEAEATLVDLDVALAAADARLEELASDLAALAEELEALEVARNSLQTLLQAVGRLDERGAGLQVRLEQARRALEAAQQAGQILAESEAGHQAYLCALERQRAMEVQREARARLQRELGDSEVRSKLAQERLQRAARDLQLAEDAAAEAERLRPQAEEQARLEAAVREAQGHLQQAKAAAKVLQRERTRLADLDRRLAEVVSGLEELPKLQKERVQHQDRQARLAQDLGTLRAQQARQRTMLEHIEGQTATLAGVTTPQCPVCEGGLSAERRDELLQRNAQQAASHRAELQKLAGQEAESQAQGRALNSALQALEDRLARLPRPAERDALLAQCAAQRHAIEEAKGEATRLAKVRTQLEALQGELTLLGVPRRAYERALDVAGRRAALAADLARERAALAAESARLAELEAELATFAQLDGDLLAVRQALAGNEAPHLRYLQYQREAQALPERQAQLAELQAALQAAQATRQALELDLAKARQAHRPGDYARVSDAHRQGSDEYSRLAALAGVQREQLGEVQARIGRLRAIAGRLNQAEGEVIAWREAGQTLEFLRKVLREAGPQVTKALVESISYGAARLYSDIISDQTSRLRWSEDYEVQLEHRGYERTFQQLSGGEQMAAALAVRLALLREVSDINLAFFDEPTANMDDTRRDNLAEQILAIGGFSQMFVVSHDDTFERATDHIVRISREAGASQVVR